ncbi:hypothetical protein AHF37_06943 [Paragonimus kellicotti]|nr:hypothetical protein AHF37_06943 [Paragonimus kellicotti]
MMADLSTVECLYNVAVDLVGLNSRQVRALLTGYRRDGGENETDSTEDGRIPGNWIDFVVSGVQLSEDGRDLGIYVRGVVPESGASQARLYHTSANTQSDPESPLLKPGDHLLAVNDQSVLELSQEAAAQLVASAGPEVSLTVVRNSTMCIALAKSADPRSVYRSSPTTSAASEPNEIFCEKCPECRLQASLITSPVNLIISDNKDSGPHRMPSTDVAFSVSSERSLDRVPPPVPSALGPVLHLFEPKPRTSADCISADTTGAFSPRTWAAAHSSSEQHPMFRSINSRLQSPEPATQYNHQSPSANNIRIAAYNSSFSTSALHQTVGSRWTSEYSARKVMPSATGHVSESRSTLNDLEEPVESEYSLGTSTGPVDSSCSSLLWRTHVSIPQPCHRPKGQSASFDEWLSVVGGNIRKSTLQDFQEYLEQISKLGWTIVIQAEKPLASNKPGSLIDRLSVSDPVDKGLDSRHRG